MDNKPLVLMILDGWGYREAADDNAIHLGNTPTWDALMASCPHARLNTSGLAVGLPEGQMGNSEVGHMNIGAGRIVYQDFTRISKAIKDGSFTTNEALVGGINRAKDAGGAVHIMGLLSPGGVHSHDEHFQAAVILASEHGASQVYVHAFLDGRDTPPRSAADSIRDMEELLDSIPNAQLASVNGRYYAMDRDQRWDRVERAWHAIVNGMAPFQADNGLVALQEAYDRDENDEFVQPTVITGYPGVNPGDAVLFINFRADRARELTRAFVETGFEGFDRVQPDLSAFVCMTEYQAGLPVDVAFPNESLPELLGEILAEHGLRQLRIAETEKYAHVTFFMNGGREEPFEGETRILIQSPRVATYDLQPEMSAPELAEKLDAAIRSGDFDVILCNVANPDMVGHSGKLDAAIKAVEAVDRCLGTVVEALEATGGEMLVTADHGNVEQMTDPASHQAHTAHTTNPVPLVFRGRPARLEEEGSLRDIAPTLLYLLGIPQPASMTGTSLLKLANDERSVA